MNQTSEQEVAVDQIKPNPWNRKSFDSQGLQELADSIKAKGIIEPLIVRKAGDGKYELASGERRWKASLLAGLKGVPCIIQDLSDEDVQDLNLVSNIQREDIPALEKANMVKALMKPGMTQDQIARKLGKSRQWVTDLLGFLDLPKEVHDNVSGIPLGMSHLQAIASLPTPEYQEQLAQEIKEGKVPLEAVDQRARHLKTGYQSSQAKRAKKMVAVVPLSSPPNEPVGGPLISSKISMASPPVAAGNDDKFGSLQLLTSLKDDVADKYLPDLGRVGTVLRGGLDTAWQKANGTGQRAKGILKWGLLFAVVSWLWNPALRFMGNLFAGLSHGQKIDSGTANSTGNPIGPAPAATSVPAIEATRLTPAMITSVKAPTGLKAEMVSGHSVRFSWEPVPGAAGYNFYSAYEKLDFTMENTHLFKSTQALWKPSSGAAIYRIAVTAVDAADHESAFSEAITMDMR